MSEHVPADESTLPVRALLPVRHRRIDIVEEPDRQRVSVERIGRWISHRVAAR